MAASFGVYKQRPVDAGVAPAARYTETNPFVLSQSREPSPAPPAALARSRFFSGPAAAASAYASPEANAESGMSAVRTGHPCQWHACTDRAF